MLSRRPYLAASGAWLVLVAVFFWPAVFAGKVIAPLDILDSLLRPWAHGGKISVHNAFTYDAISQYLPYDWSVYQSIQQDGKVGWNPYVHSGCAIQENTMLCPGDWRHYLYRFLPFWSAWNLGIILQFALAGIGMLLFLRDRGIPASAALVGVIGFGFYSQFILWIQHRWVLGALCWLPWIAWAILRQRKSGRLISLPAIAFIALAFRGGHLQACLHVVLFVLIIAAVEWWQTPAKFQPKVASRLFLPYAASGILGAFFALDVFVQTIPPLLEGLRKMPDREFADTLKALPTLVTTLIPTAMGTPQGLDILKHFGADFFAIKFAGAMVSVMACFTLRDTSAPLLPKVLLLLGLLLPFTPADKWLYSRFTVVFAFGATWLAAWWLARRMESPRPLPSKWGWVLLGLFGGSWLLASIGILWKEPLLAEKIQALVAGKLDESKSDRLEWMNERTLVFLDHAKLWHPRNLLFLTSLGLSWFLVTRIKAGRSHALALGVALCAFVELFTFSNTWITWSPRPPGDVLYPEPAWATRLKSRIANGRMLYPDRSDFDYLQLNTPAAHGIRFADGYETVTPRRISPRPVEDWNPSAYAAAGVSHLIFNPRSAPASIPGWEMVERSPEYTLFKNPLFQGLFLATSIEGAAVPIEPTRQTSGSRDFLLPPRTTRLVIAESFHPGWEFSLDNTAWSHVSAAPGGGMSLDLPSPVDVPTRLMLRFTQPSATLFQMIMLAMAVALAIFGIWRKISLATPSSSSVSASSPHS